MSRDPTCTIVGDAAGLAALRSHWWELWRRVRATPFQAPARLAPWWHAFAPGNPLVIAARRVGRLVGLAPFYLEHGARRRLLPIGISVSDYHDILVQDGDAAAIREAIMACVADHHAEWRVWELPELPPRSQALSLPVPPGCIEVVEQASACPVLALPADAGAFVQRLPYRKRRWVRMAQNRARRRGELACVAAADARHARDILETLFRLHGACWKQRGEAGVLANARVRAFHREAPRRMLQAGLLRMFELRIAGAAAAVYYGFHHRDPTDTSPGLIRATRSSPGVILLAHVIENAICEGAREFHFLRGREPYKYGWGAEDRWNTKRVFRRPEARTEAHARAS